MKFKTPPRLQHGDKVAIISPSSGLASIFPWVYEWGLKQLREVFSLEPVEFPTARQSSDYLEKNPQARADDINAAFADPSIKALIATIGGNDQIRILPYLNSAVIAANPKAFVGYSDCTNLHLVLWNLGIVSYYGASILSQFAMQGAMHDFTIHYLKKALFDSTIGQIEEAPEWTDFDLEWADPQTLTQQRPLYPSEGWEWYNHHHEIIQGRLWGGCLEILDLHLSVKRYLPSSEQLAGTILYLETSEEMPSEGFVYRFMAALGELEVLAKFKALLVGYPKTQFFGRSLEGRESFRLNQQNAIKKALRDYQAPLPVVFNLNFGHTDPQLIVPHGGEVVIDGMQKTISFSG